MLENLRYYPEEEGKPVGVEKGTPEYDAAKAEMKERQKDFAKKLASYADVYVTTPSVQLTASMRLQQLSLTTSMLTTRC